MYYITLHVESDLAVALFCLLCTSEVYSILLALAGSGIANVQEDAVGSKPSLQVWLQVRTDHDWPQQLAI